MTTPETGFLVIADLTGYTAYLSRSELEHAPAIAGDLLETIVGRLEPPFRLAKFEGDAAFLFVEDGRADGVAPARCRRGELVVPDVGPVVATADLEAADAGTASACVGSAAGEESVDAAIGERLSRDKTAAFGRLATAVATA